jgi:acetyl-CoA carboxylase carboxyltransferase component
MPFDEPLSEYERRKAKALSMGGPEKLARRRDLGVLNARERVAHLVDEDSFLESGLFATSARPEMAERTPADGRVTGFAKIDGRHVAIVAHDYTVLGSSSSHVGAAKLKHIKDVATRRGLPLVILGESSGGRIPDMMGSAAVAAGDYPTQFQRTRESPWVTAVLGHCYGNPAWYAALSDYVVMRKGAVMAVSSARLASMATTEQIDAEALGGWQVHTEKSGLVDIAVDSDQEALDLCKRFLTYLPSHQNEKPPVAEVPGGSEEPIARILELVPESRTQTYDMRKVVAVVADKGSVFELKPSYGKAVITALARIRGRVVGVVANNPRFKGGAIDPEACAKVVSFLVFCDSFNVPLVFLVDTPGFLIGADGEIKGAIGKIMNWMNALSLCSVPKISIVIRKSYGQAVYNMGGAGNSDELACWPMAEVSFMEPSFGVTVASGIREQDDPERFRELLAEATRNTSAYALASAFAAKTIIDPRETRDYLAQTLDVHMNRMTNGVGLHLMRTWPTSH